MRRCLFLWLGCAISLFIISIPLYAAESAIPQQVLSWQNAAQDNLSQKNYSEAIKQYRQITSSLPGTVYAYNAWGQIAKLSVQTNQFAQVQLAVTELCTTYRDQPGMYRKVFDLVIDYTHSQHYTEAFSIANEVQNQLTPQSRVILVTGWLGMIYAHQGNTQQAEQITETVLKSEGSATDFLDAMGNIGWGYFCNGRWDDAIKTYRQGIKRFPAHKSSATLQYHIVQAVLKKGDIVSAKTEMVTLLNQYSKMDYTLGLASRLAQEFRNQKQEIYAIEIYQKLLAEFSTHSGIAGVQDSLVETYADMKKLSLAQDAIRTDIEKYPGHKGLLRMITRVAIETARSGDVTEAKELTQAIFNQKPQGTEQLFAYTTLARVYVHEGKDAEAKKIMEAMLTQFQNDPDALIYHLYGIGEEYLFKHDMSQLHAIDIWQRLINLNPAHKKAGDIVYNCGLIYWNQKDYGNAMSCFMQIAVDWPTYKETEDSLLKGAECFLKLHEKGEISDAEAEEGLTTIQGLLASKHSTASQDKILWGLGQLKFKSKQWADAAKYLEMWTVQPTADTSKDLQSCYLLGQAYENTGDNEKSVRYYTEYLDSLKTGDMRQTIAMQKKIQRLQLKLKPSLN
jgi:tetratricopeptide (TPR) repeat protein